jgi:hypothetical protein
VIAPSQYGRLAGMAIPDSADIGWAKLPSIGFGLAII